MKKHIKFIICILLVSATLIVYWRTANHDFISYDDPFYITENRHVQNGLTIDGVIWAFTNKETGYLHPLTWLSYMLDYELYGLNPMGYHWTNLEFHIVNTVLLFLVLNFMTSALWRSAFVAALFALHPLHVESVAWISERKDVLSTFFFILSIWAYVSYTRSPSKKKYFILIVFFILGLMSKPMLVTLPFVLLLLDYWPLERFLIPDFFNPKFISSNDTPKLPFLRLISEKIPLFILSGFACFATVYMQQSTIKTVLLSESIPLKLRIYNAVVTYVTYIGKMFRPYHLSVFYSYPKTFNMGMVFGCGFLLGCISFIIILISSKYPYLITGWFWYLGILFPVIGLIPVSFYSMADRYTYISLIGLFVIISWGIKDISSRWRFKKIILSVSASVILISIMISTWFQVGYWRNSKTVFSHALNVTQNNWLAHNGLGMALSECGKLDKAILHYKKALSIRPDYIQALNNSGIAFFGLGKYDDAIFNFKKVLSVDPYNTKANYNLGKALSERKDFEGAILCYSNALKFKPEFARAHVNLAILLSDQGKTNEALYHFYEAIRINPENPDYHINLANLLIKMGKNDEAVVQISRGLGLINFNNPNNVNPYYAKVFNELGKALVNAGRFKKAEIFFSRAIQIDPEYTEACRNLNVLKQKMLLK